MKRIGPPLAVLAAVACMMAGAPSATAAASKSTMIDIASYQTGISVPATGVDIAIVKISQGNYYTNPDHARAIGQAQITGMGVGGYDFADTSVGATVEADYYLARIMRYKGTGFLPVLDWEPSNPCDVTWARTWLDRVYSRFGVAPWIYMNMSTEASCSWPSSVTSRYGLWLAGGRYYNTTLTKDQAPAAYWSTRHWRTVAAWQYTSHGRVNGWSGNVDLSVFYGSMGQFNQYAKASSNGAAANYKSYASTAKSTVPTGSAASIARDVIKGLYGNGSQRRATLGSRYSEVMKIVNQLLAKTTTSSTTSSYCVIVRSGDTLGKIATRTGRKTYSAWTGYRSGNPNVIYVGETVCYKTTTSTTTSSRTWTVTKGQTLSYISAKTGVSVSRLASLNGIRNVNLIYVGQRIRY